MSETEYIEVLKSRYSRIRDELEVLHKQYSSIMDEMMGKQEVAKRISELLAAEGHPVDDTRVVRDSGARIVDLAFDFLDQRDGCSPIHYKELARVLISNDVIIAGKDPSANLLAQINRDNRFVRVGPGKYALAKWKTKPRVPTRSKRKKRRR